MKIHRVFLSLSAVFAATAIVACATPSESRRFASSRVLPCGPDEIAVSNIDSPGMSMRFYWTAVCKGIRYNCTGIADGKGDTNDIVCK